MKRGVSNYPRLALGALTTLVLGLSAQTAAQADGVTDRKIGYVLVDKAWAVYQTPGGKQECPNGFNDGPREQFKALFPEGKSHDVLETHLSREADIWFPRENEPANEKGALAYHDAVSKIGIGLDLDGKAGPNDFIGPDGEKGIDNQLYRVIGCVSGFRGPDGAYYFFQNEYMRRYNFNRVLIEITDVDDLINDDDVTVTTYRGLNSLLTSANGKDIIPGATQKIDERWGKRYIHSLKGKIVGGELITEPGDLVIPYADTFQTNVDQAFKGARFRLKLTATSAEGLMGAYVDIDDWHHQLSTNWGAAHHASYGQMALASIVRAARRLADAYPDPATGKNTAISSAHELKFVQTHILHSAKPEKRTVASAK
jgi:hypothetical protein